MTTEGDAEHVRADIADFVSSVGRFWKAQPDENQYIIGEVTKQVQKADVYRREALRGRACS